MSLPKIPYTMTDLSLADAISKVAASAAATAKSEAISAGRIRIPVLNNSSTLVQTLEVLVEITVGDRQASGISVS